MEINQKPKIAIWGATGHIGSALYDIFRNAGYDITGFARNIEKAKKLRIDHVFRFDDFPQGGYDILINAIAADGGDLAAIFETLEQYDFKLIQYAKTNPHCACITFSSGTVYGDFRQSADEGSQRTLTPNHVPKGDVYGLIKFICEQRHLSYGHLKLVDIRVFAFFSHYADLNKPFFMNDLAKAILNNIEITVAPGDFCRDFIDPEDLFSLILLCWQRSYRGTLDAYSQSPIKKSEILSILKDKYGLKYSAGESWASATGEKAYYYSGYKKAETLGYAAQYSSKQTILKEMDKLICQK